MREYLVEKFTTQRYTHRMIPNPDHDPNPKPNPNPKPYVITLGGELLH